MKKRQRNKRKGNRRAASKLPLILLHGRAYRMFIKQYNEDMARKEKEAAVLRALLES